MSNEKTHSYEWGQSADAADVIIWENSWICCTMQHNIIQPGSAAAIQIHIVLLDYVNWTL